MIRLLLATLAATLAAAAPAHAHALLEGTSPERGAVSERAPGQVVLRFSEPVEIAFGAVNVFRARGGGGEGLAAISDRCTPVC